MRYQRYLARLVLTLSFSLLPSGCFLRPANTKNIRYDASGRLELVEVRGHTWAEFFDMLRRESGLLIDVRDMPAGFITLRIENSDSWEHVLKQVASAKNFELTPTGPKSYRLTPKP